MAMILSVSSGGHQICENCYVVLHEDGSISAEHVFTKNTYQMWYIWPSAYKAWAWALQYADFEFDD